MAHSRHSTCCLNERDSYICGRIIEEKLGREIIFNPGELLAKFECVNQDRESCQDLKHRESSFVQRQRELPSGQLYTGMEEEEKKMN